MQDWNDLRKENEEFVIKHGAEKMGEQVDKDKGKDEGGAGQAVDKSYIQEGVEPKRLSEFEDTQKNFAQSGVVTVSQFKKEREKVQRDTNESEFERVDGISKVVIDQLEEKLIAKIETLDQKINNLNVYTERIFGGMTEEIIKIESGGKLNNNSSSEYGMLGSRIEDVNQFLNVLIQNNNHINTTNNYMLECLKIILTLMAADEVDKESFGLYGIKESLSNESQMMSSKFISEKKVNKGSSLHIQSNVFDSKNILDRDRINMNMNNSFLPDIHLVNAGISNNENMRYNKDKDSKQIDTSIQRIGNLNFNSNTNINNITPLPHNFTKKQNFSNLNSNISLKPNNNENISVSLSNQCLSCVGNKALINQAFKLACLN